MTSTEHPQPIYGAAFVGITFKITEEFEPILAALLEENISRIDTAAWYPPPNQGESERILGHTGAASKGIQVDTKVLLSSFDGSGQLSADAIDKSIQQSLDRLQTNKIDTLYCHCFDPVTPQEETAAAMDRHYRAGVFEQWGVCRYTVDELTELLSICEKHGYQKPTVYQGEYNVLTRGTEGTILPLLRQHGIAYNAHRPFATGYLTGKFVRGQAEGTRYADDAPLSSYFRKEYGSQALKDAMNVLETACAGHNIAPHEAAFRWILFHSVLGPNDGVIFGASKVAQIQENAKAIKKGPLPAGLVSAMDELWPKYFVGTEREQVR